MNKKLISLLVFAMAFSLLSLGFRGVDEKDKKVQKPNINDNYKFIAVNQILMWISNNGDGSHDPGTDGPGFFWPGGRNAVKAAIFEDGLVYAGRVGREIRMNGNTHRKGLEAGKILPDGTRDDPTLAKYRVYKIKKGWENLAGAERAAYEKDYNEWPVEDGAPWVDVDGDGVFTRGVDQPEYVGDEVLWYVANDLDEQKTVNTYGSLPMGLEFQTTVFGFNRTGALGDMVFKKYKIINKGSNKINEMYLGYWSDTDLGDGNDDFTGCDTTLSLGYTYNATNNDGVYGTPPPAVGYDFFQGPLVAGAPEDSGKFLGVWRHGYKNLPMTAFAFYINGSALYKDPSQGLYAGTLEFYNYMQGLVWNGDPFIDPTTNQPARICLAGDPVAHTGWYDGPTLPGGQGPDDRRHLMSSGPFTLVPGDTQEIVVGLVIAKGTSNLNSVTALKTKDRAAQVAYDLDFQLTPPPPQPEMGYVPQDQKVTLYWNTNAESYDAGDPLLYGQGLADTTYTFEGYRIWAFQDITGTNPVLITTVDLVDGITDIYDVQNVNGADVSVPVIRGTDNGIQRYFTINTDVYTNNELRNGNPYYYGVSAYGYSPNSSPSYLENPPTVMEVMPGKPSISADIPYNSGDNIFLQQSTGQSDAVAKLQVIVPGALTGNEYAVKFHGNGTGLTYDFVNKTTGDTLIRNSNDFNQDSTKKQIIDGFVLLVKNIGQEKVDAVGSGFTSAIKSVLETKGPGGTDLSTPINVVTHKNSTDKWQLVVPGTPVTADVKQNINWVKTIGTDDYEIRFTATDQGSEFYSTKYTALASPLKDNYKGKGKVPFQVYLLRRATDSTYRMMVKIAESIVKDSTWSQSATGLWEEIYAYTTPTGYSEPIPNQSGPSTNPQHRFGALQIQGDVPDPGTVVKITSWKPLQDGDEFKGVATAPKQSTEIAKNNIDKITVFPNPYFGANNLERDKYQRFVRFGGLPEQVTVRIFSLSGVFIQKMEKNDPNQWLDWDLRNKDGLPVASGVYLAYLDMPNIGTKVMKIAVIMETQFIDRL